MNFLKSVNTIRPMLRWSQRAGSMTAPTYCCVKYTTSWTGESRDEFNVKRLPLIFQNRFLHSKKNATSRDLTGLPLRQPQQVNVLKQITDSLGPYGKLMRMDRPIGN